MGSFFDKKYFDRCRFRGGDKKKPKEKENKKDKGKEYPNGEKKEFIPGRGSHGLLSSFDLSILEE
jgi:hypothetical protein